MKVVFFGAPEFAVHSLQSLVESGINVVEVVTHPDRTKNRKGKVEPSPVKKCAVELGLKLFQPKNFVELKNNLHSIKADFFVTIAYGMILPPEILKIPEIVCVNVHASLLPKYRGASPIQEALLNGDKSTGISIIKMNEKLDQGDVYIIKKLSIHATDNAETLTLKLAKLGAQMLPHTLMDIKEGLLQPIPQDDDHIKASYCRKIRKEDGKINWNSSASRIENMIRAYTPWPSAFTEFRGKTIKILKATVSEEKIPPGEFLKEGETLKIGTANGSLIPATIQLEGKKEMDIKSFINGYMK